MTTKGDFSAQMADAMDKHWAALEADLGIASGSDAREMLRLVSESTWQIAGRGTVKVIRNPGANDQLWRKVQASKGAEIEIDGERFTLLSIELAVPMMHMGEPDAMAYCSTWGLVVRPKNAVRSGS